MFFLNTLKSQNLNIILRPQIKLTDPFFSKTIRDIEDILVKEKPNYLMVQGDTNTAFAGCFASSIYNRKFFENKKKLRSFT